MNRDKIIASTLLVVMMFIIGTFIVQHPNPDAVSVAGEGIKKFLTIALTQ